MSNFPGILARKILNTSRRLLKISCSSYFHNEILSVSTVQKLYLFASADSHFRYCTDFLVPSMTRASSDRCPVIKRCVGVRIVIQTLNGFVTKAGSAGRKVGSSPRRLVFARKTATSVYYHNAALAGRWRLWHRNLRRTSGSSGTRDTVAE